MVGKSKTHYEVKNLLYLRKATDELKSDGGITIRFTRVGWGENEMSIEAHGDA